MKRYIPASIKSNNELLKSFVGKDEWVLVDLVGYYDGKVREKALIKIIKVRGSVDYYKISLDFNYNNEYDDAISYVADLNVSLDNVYKRIEHSYPKECVHVVEPIESYTTAELENAIRLTQDL